MLVLKKMKNVFYIHSHVTLAVSLGIIEKNKIDKKDIVFLLGRGFIYSNNKIDNIVAIPHDIQSVVNIKSHNILGLILGIIRFDKWVNSFCSNCYYLYIPHSRLPVARGLSTHKKCKGFSYIEEGLLSYSNYGFGSDKKDKLGPIIRSALLPWRRFSSLKYYNSSYQNLFGLNDDAFHGRERVKRVDGLFYYSPCLDNISFTEQSSVFVLQNIGPMSSIATAVYVSVIIDELKRQSNNGNSIYYKLHPEQYFRSESDFFRGLMKCYGAIELGENVSIEALSIKNPNITLVSLVSSVFFYIPKDVLSRSVFLFKQFSLYASKEAEEYFVLFPDKYKKIYGMID